MNLLLLSNWILPVEHIKIRHTQIPSKDVE